VRHAVMIDGMSQREAARCFGIDPRTVRKMLSYSIPPGYVRTRPPVRPKLDPYIAVIERVLEDDKERPKKQRHTSKRIFERLRDEYGFTGAKPPRIDPSFSSNLISHRILDLATLMSAFSSTSDV